jgi:hypothetical protein
MDAGRGLAGLAIDDELRLPLSRLAMAERAAFLRSALLEATDGSNAGE